MHAKQLEREQFNEILFQSYPLNYIYQKKEK